MLAAETVNPLLVCSYQDYQGEYECIPTFRPRSPPLLKGRDGAVVVL